MSDGLRWATKVNASQHKVSLTRTDGESPSLDSTMPATTEPEQPKRRGGWQKGKPRGRAFGAKISKILKARADRIREGKATAAPTESEVA